MRERSKFTYFANELTRSKANALPLYQCFAIARLTENTMEDTNMEGQVPLTPEEEAAKKAAAEGQAPEAPAEEAPLA